MTLQCKTADEHQSLSVQKKKKARTRTRRKLKKRPKTSMTSQSQESLRWAGELADPVGEEKRIELYKANRRKRYLAAREGLLKSLVSGDNQ